MTPAGIVSNLLAWSLQIGAVAAAAALLPSLFRLDVAGVRYAYWRSVALLCLALPWIQPYRLGHVVATTVTLGGSPAVADSARSIAQPLQHPESASLVLFVLASGSIIRLAWLAVGLVKLRRLRRTAVLQQPAAVDVDLQQALPPATDVRYVKDLGQPVTFGLRKPIVLLPDSLRTRSADIQRAVIGHELLHVQRRDWGWLILEELAVCVFWFHPAVWWLASRIQLAREEVVDELAILLTGRRKAYVEALLAFADSTSVLPTAAFARRRHLFRRIALVSKEDVMSSRRIVATCAAMALIVLIGSWYAVSAFPLRATDQAAGQDFQMRPGPLEQKAHTVTPENPVPRRLNHEDPVWPDSVASVRANVGVKLTLDALGRVAEARIIELAMEGPDYGMTLSGIDANGFQWTGTVKAQSEDTRAKAIGTVEAIMRAALASVRQWRYDAPAEGPLTFTVDMRIGNGPEVMAFKPAPREGALRVGGNIAAPEKIRHVPPVYPPVAQAANVTGVVVMEVRIGVDGNVEEAHVLRSIPLLDQAALDAVKQWQFRPTLLNGRPVPITMTVTINFTQQ